MAFPETGILDNFNRSNQGPPPTGWTTIYNGHVVSSNQLLGNTANDANVSVWNTTGYGPSIEAYITLVNVAAVPALYLLDSTLDNGYCVQFNLNNSVTISRVDTFGGAQTELGSISQTFVDGDALGIYYDASNDTIYAYRKSGSTWSQLGSRSDSTYTSLSRIALFTYTQWPVEDFGGGTVGAAAVVTSMPAAFGSELHARVHANLRR